MERKDRDFHVDHETDSKSAELATYMEEYISTNKDAQSVKNRLDEVSAEYDSFKKEEDALKKRLGETMDRLNKVKKRRNNLTKRLGESRERLHKIEHSFRLVIGTEYGGGSSGAGGSGQEAGDVKTGGPQGNQSGETRVEGKGKDSVTPGGGYSGESEKQKKQGDTGDVSG